MAVCVPTRGTSAAFTLGVQAAGGQVLWICPKENNTLLGMMPFEMRPIATLPAVQLRVLGKRRGNPWDGALKSLVEFMARFGGELHCLPAYDSNGTTIVMDLAERAGLEVHTFGPEGEESMEDILESVLTDKKIDDVCLGDTYDNSENSQGQA